VVDLNVEFVNNPNDLDYCGLASTLASIACYGSLSTIVVVNLSTTIIPMRLHGQHSQNKEILKSKKITMPQHWFLMQQTMF
jgi:hypothetical protein